MIIQKNILILHAIKQFAKLFQGYFFCDWWNNYWKKSLWFPCPWWI